MDPYVVCGCSGAATNCTFCQGRTVDTAAIVPNGPQGAVTCGELVSFAPNITDPTVCNITSVLYEPFCCPTHSRCNICPSNSSVGYVDQPIPFLNLTCGLAELIVAAEPPNKCAKAQASNMDLIDIPAICGCQGSSPPNTCSFCNVSQMPNPNFPILVLNELGTCGGFGVLAKYVVNQTFCQEEFAKLAQGCCLSPSRPCSVCPDKSMVGYPTKTVPSTRLTCLDLDILAGFDTTGSCPQTSRENLDYAAYCGCKGATAPNQCSFCPTGYAVTDPTLPIPFQNGMTCSQAQDLATYVVNATICSQDIARFATYCCHISTGSNTNTASGTPSTGTTATSTSNLNGASGGVVVHAATMGWIAGSTIVMALTFVWSVLA